MKNSIIVILLLSACFSQTNFAKLGFNSGFYELKKGQKIEVPYNSWLFNEENVKRILTTEENYKFSVEENRILKLENAAYKDINSYYKIHFDYSKSVSSKPKMSEALKDTIIFSGGLVFGLSFGAALTFGILKLAN
jgi:hypothetical protein